MAILSAKNTLLKLGGATSPVVFVTIAEVRSIAGPTTAAEIVDVTTHSTTGFWRQKFAVLIDPGQITFPMNYDPAQATHLFASGLWFIFINLTVRDMEMVFPSAAGKLAFEAQVMRHEFQAPVDNVLQVNTALQIRSEIVATN